MEQNEGNKADLQEDFNILPEAAGNSFSPYTDIGPHFHPPITIHADSVIDPKNKEDYFNTAFANFDYK